MSLDAYLQLDGIQGEATESNHQNWIQLLKITHEIDQQTSKNPPGGQRKAVANSKHEPIQIVKTVDKSTPVLHEKCCSGQTIAKATIDLLKDAGQQRVTYLKYELTKVLVASVSFNGDHATENEEPTETVSLKYDTIKWTYSITDPNGSVTGSVPGVGPA